MFSSPKQWYSVLMGRDFKTVDYAAALQQTVTIEECLSPNHLARFVVGILALLDLSPIYARYAPIGGEAYAPEILLGLLFYGYATGLFSSRKIEKATHESIPFRFIAGGLHPDHDTLANFRKTFLSEIKALFVQVLVVAQEAGALQLGNISLDGSKIHADASKSQAVSYKRLLELESQLRQEVEALFALGEQIEQGHLQDGLNIADEIAFRQGRLVNLADAKAVLEQRAQERFVAEQAEYQAKQQAREAKAQQTGRKPGGRPPTPPTPGPQDDDQYNFTDPDSRIMKNSTNKGVDQHYNAQVAVDQESLLIVATTLSNHPSPERSRTIKPKRYPPWMPSLPRLASRTLRRWTMVTSVPTPSSSWKPVRLSRTSLLDASRITRVGKRIVRSNRHLPRQRPHRGRRWLTNCRPTSAN